MVSVVGEKKHTHNIGSSMTISNEHNNTSVIANITQETGQVIANVERGEDFSPIQAHERLYKEMLAGHAKYSDIIA